MCVVTDKMMLPPTFLLKWGKRWWDVGKKGQRTRRNVLGTSEIHRSEAASEKIVNTYLCWGQFC